MAVNGKAQHVLIVEDEIVIAVYLEDLLVEIGHQVARLATRMEMAVELARGELIGLAILDVNVEGTQSFPVVDILRERGIPFIFATGYGFQGLLDGYDNEVVVQKPFEPKVLELLTTQALSR